MLQNSAFGRWFLIIVSLVIISLVFWNSYSFFNSLKENERVKMEIWTEAQKTYATEDLESTQLNLVLNILKMNTTTPMISYNHIDSTYNHKNFDESLIDTPEKREQFITRFAEENEPIISEYKGKTYNTIYYGNSPLINKLKLYPLLLVLIVALFISALYFFYKTSRSAETNRLWAGMAKETAHQIGTPLSSLLGWSEILRSEDVNPEYLDEMNKDINRLETIADRFGKVGSVPVLNDHDIVKETIDAYDYLKTRTSKLVDFNIEIPDEKIIVKLNPQLYSWTIENLVKNGIDAMRGKGTISIKMEHKGNLVIIKITDAGKGIPKKDFKNVFRPGFTTKKRGWGLGLSLAKRIIEEYHRGRIRVCNSIINEGTTMEIVMKVA
ncbi:sensor histidine kinase [unidentified eubacterium SCB49]|nr:sensor histidine kinase [unidentified eubacterium SCB49]